MKYWRGTTVTFLPLFSIFHLLLLLFPSTSDALAQDFCVADLSLPDTPSGYPCKNPSLVTADDFVFTAFRDAANTSNSNRAGVIPGFVNAFPALNGLGLSVVRVDFAPGGAVPIHSHPEATELIVLVRGTITAGFVAGLANNHKVYYKTLRAGDTMVFPQGLLHFQVNTGKKPAMGIVSFSSPNPGVQLLPVALFGNALPSDIVEKVSSVDLAEVKKLKALFGGSG